MKVKEVSKEHTRTRQKAEGDKKYIENGYEVNATEWYETKNISDLGKIDNLIINK